MYEETLIAWAHHTINFWWGCNMVSKECQGCYVDEAMTNKKLNFNVVRRTSDWGKAYSLNAEAARQEKCALVFTCSYSDFFHKDADLWRPKVWQIIRECKNLIWLILTKRPERIKQCLPPDWGDGYDNVWLGVTVGVKASYPRLEELRKVPCKLRFISIEPLLESLSDINLTGFSWLLVGGMSGPTWAENKMQIEWAAEIYERSKDYPDVHYFYKQSSARRSERGIDALGRYLGLLKGGKADLIREIPPADLPMLPLSIEKGHRFTDDEWTEYQQASPPSAPTLPSLLPGTQFVPVEALST
jgi:protein gp37